MDIPQGGRHIRPCVLLAMVLIIWPGISVAASLIMNGDFDLPNPLGAWMVTNTVTPVSNPTGVFAVIGGDPDCAGALNCPAMHSLAQVVNHAPPLATFSFTFVFATEANALSAFPDGVFPDTFFVSLTAPGVGTLPVLFIEADLGVDTSAMLDPSVTIPDFLPPFPVDFTRSGRLTLDLRGAPFALLVGMPLTIAFDVLNEPDGFRTAAAIDQVILAPAAVPEPGTLGLLGSALAGLAIWCVYRQRASGRR